MALKEYKSGESFNGVIGRTVDESSPAWPEPLRAKKGAPNVLFIVLDDTGFGQLGCYGSPINTPNIDKLAKNGLLYNNMHTTALCSPTRSCVLTGRNHHSNHVAAIMELSTGYPGSDCYIPFENGFLSEILLQNGYNTYCVGKWHLSPPEQISAAGPYDRWPLGRGFERYYGFLPGDTHQYYPDLTYDNHSIEPPKTPEEGYHLTEDLADHAISFIANSKQVAPNKPFFMYFATGAMHAPHHVPKEWADKYKGKFDQGWDVYREHVFKKQKKLGILPKNAELSPHDPDVQDWDKLPKKERKLYARMMEVFAGFLEHTDYHIGRVLKFLEELGELDNTLIMLISDNGASSEGGTAGSVNENKFFNAVPESLEDNLAAIDELGGPKYFNHYPWGWSWAGNTPFRRWKKETYRGGISDPFIVSWPKGIKARSEIRTQYAHAIDMVPTVLDALGIDPPTEIRGVAQSPIEGKSFAEGFDNVKADCARATQYFEMFSHRSIYHHGWRAVCPFPGPSYAEGEKELGYKFGDSVTADIIRERDQNGWELYKLDEDFTECHNVAEKYPDVLQELITLWYAEAGKYNVLPLDGPDMRRFAAERPQLTPNRSRYIYFPDTQPVPASAAVSILNRSHVIAAMVEFKKGNEGVLLAHGGNVGGYSLFVKDNKLHYVYNYAGVKEFHLVSDKEISEGKVILSFEFEATGKPDSTKGKGAPGIGKLYFNEDKVAETELPLTLPVLLALGEGLTCGYDNGTSTSQLYKTPFKFTGILHRVAVDVSGEKIESPKAIAEIKAALARQ